MIVLAVIMGLQSFIVLSNYPSATARPDSALVPQAIRQGPFQTAFALGGSYWFQSGATGDNGSYSADGANITIRTVYDHVRNDAHSYWIGTLLVTGGFVQVGYLNGLSTTGQPYCCAWFFETFNTPNCNCPPMIGPEGSAGPIGSWHTYSMVHASNGIWNFYMDGNLLGSSPPPSDKNYLGGGATNSGDHAPAGIAEVAQTSDNKDVIGPAEFTSLEIRKAGQWNPMLSGLSHVDYGYGSLRDLPNPYGVWEVEGHDNDFLVGSNIRLPTSGTTLWPTSVQNPTQLSLNFIDHNGNPFSPDWISLEDLGNVGNVLYLTSYSAQTIPQSGNFYKINYEYWHGVNVSNGSLVSMSPSIQTIQGDVFSIPVHVIGRFYSLPVGGATVLTFLPDSTNETVKTDSAGNATLVQLPPGNYSLRVAVPYGVQSLLRTSVAGPAAISIAVFSIAELLTLIIPPITAAVGVVMVAVRREHARRAATPIPMPFPTIIPAAYCGACGKPLGQTELFCTTCGTPRALQPSPPRQLPP